MNNIGFEEITFLLEHEYNGGEFEMSAVIRKTDIESIHNTTNPKDEDQIRCVITMKSGNAFVTNESYKDLRAKLLPKA